MPQVSAKKLSKRPSLHHKVASLVTFAIALIIAGLTLTPMSLPDNGPDGVDKLYHAIAFAALVLPYSIIHPRALWWLLPSALLFGGAIEILQPLVGRSRELADFWADSVGIAVGVVSGLVAYSLRSSASSAIKVVEGTASDQSDR